MKTPVRRRLSNRLNYLFGFGILLIAVVGMALPTVNSSSLAEKTSAGNNAGSRFFATSNWMPNIAPAALAGETVEVLASDCVTPQSSFATGETVCAKTNGVDLTVAANHYMNWIDSSLNQTNGGTITQNPQYFLFVPPTNGTWKATIGRVTPADSSIIGVPPTFTVSAGPSISTYEPTCVTPKTAFTLGETVCATVSGIDPTFNRRLSWVDPAGNVRDTTPITTDPQNDSYTLPLLPTEVLGGETVDNRGVWKVNVISSRGTVIHTTKFTVQAVIPAADLSVGKSKTGDVSSGQPVTFNVSIYNDGPNDAVNVELTDVTPANATFVSAAQTNGTDFSCTGSTTVICTSAILKAGDRATFDFVYTAGAQGQTITNTASVESDTQDNNATNDSSTDGPYTIGQGDGGGNSSCTVACPDDIETPAQAGQGGGAIVHFSPPSGNLACGDITVDHCNDCLFPAGTTVVTGTAESGESCSFTVTVTAEGSSPTISCPSNKTANADANSCSTNVAVGTATALGTNVTVIGYRSDGLPMYTCDKFGNCTRSSDAPFPAGTTTITWYAYSHDVPGPYTGPADMDGYPVNEADTEEGHRTGSATCTQTVLVKDVTPPVIAATSSTVSADANCQAVIPDYSNTVTDNCACGSADDSEDCEGHPHIVYTQTPPAGTVVGPGAHNVHIEASDGSEFNNGSTKDVTFTVEDTTAPVIDCPDNITTTTDPGVCSAVVNPGTATATDNCDSTPTITASRSDSQALNAPYPKGTTTITWRATDDTGNYSECTQTVTVNDDEAPVINFNGQTPSLWPPNHGYTTFTPSNFVTSVSDNCGSVSVSNVYVTKITSDEVENGNGDGNTMNDIVIAANCKSFQLRDEREGSGNGRVYTIFFSVVDSSGNVGTGTAKVVVKKNPNQTAVDSGPHYTVNSSCP